jgi:hypothetical protein
MTLPGNSITFFATERVFFADETAVFFIAESPFMKGFFFPTFLTTVGALVT